jgi:hypothetical protein
MSTAAFDNPPYATTEDVLLADESAIWDLIPDSQILADGEDGAIAADAWVLTSEKDFAAQGVAAGDVVHLEGTSDAALAALGASGRDYVAEEVAETSLTLRLPGRDAGDGEPPGASSGLTSLSFRVGSLRPQLAAVSRRLKRRLNYSADADLLTTDDLLDATVEATLYARFRALTREPGDHWDQSAADYRERHEETMRVLESRRKSEYAIDYIEVVPRDYPTAAEPE